jgi:hypothetical protein
MLANSRMFWNVRAMPAITTLRGFGRQHGALKDHTALCRHIEAGQAIKERGLARPIGSNQAHDLAPVYPQVD